MSYLGRSIKEVQAAFRNGSLSPSALYQDSLNRLSASKHLNAFVNVPKEPLKVENADPSRGALLLEGIPLAVKDNFCVSGTHTTCASEMLRDFKAPYTATVVERALSQGAVFLGKTNMDEFGMGSGSVDSIFGPVVNPWTSSQQIEKDFHIAGGSSGGSAVAVASGTSMLALGSDTGGSVRIPAAWCGICSLKPTYGALSRNGLIPLVNSLDVPGLMANHVEDLEIFFRALRGRDDLDSTTVEPRAPLRPFELQDLKIGIPEEYHCEGLSVDALSAWSDVIDLCHTSIPVSLPHTPYSLMCYSVLNTAEVASNMARYDGLEYGLRIENNDSLGELFSQSRSKGFNEVVKSRILIGNYFLLEENYEDFFIQALKVRHLIYKDFMKVFSQGIDLLITPVTLDDAPLHGDFVASDNRTRSMQHDYCTQPINLAGLPAVTLPVKLSKRGLPLGVQIVGRHFEDEKVLALAKHIESLVQFPKLCYSYNS